MFISYVSACFSFAVAASERFHAHYGTQLMHKFQKSLKQVGSRTKAMAFTCARFGEVSFTVMAMCLLNCARRFGSMRASSRSDEEELASDEAFLDNP